MGFEVLAASIFGSKVIKTESGSLLRLVRGGVAMKQEEEQTVQP